MWQSAEKNSMWKFLCYYATIEINSWTKVLWKSNINNRMFSCTIKEIHVWVTGHIGQVKKENIKKLCQNLNLSNLAIPFSAFCKYWLSHVSCIKSTVCQNKKAVLSGQVGGPACCEEAESWCKPSEIEGCPSWCSLVSLNTVRNQWTVKMLFWKYLILSILKTALALDLKSFLKQITCTGQT